MVIVGAYGDGFSRSWPKTYYSNRIVNVHERPLNTETKNTQPDKNESVYIQYNYKYTHRELVFGSQNQISYEL